MAFEEELALALAAAQEAAEVLEARAGAERVREKGRADLVTEVDERSERVITEQIRSLFPGDAVVAEEFSPDALLGGRSWIIDPVDGTVNYVHGHPFSCVSIGFCDADGPAVGVVHAPFLGEVYHAVRGGGAYLNGAPLRVSEVSRGEAGLYATGFPFKGGKGDPEEYFRLVAEVVTTSHGVRRAGAAALDLAYVAAGRVDGYFEIGLKPWDVAAGFLLVTEAGGRVTGWPGDAEPPLHTGRVIASNGPVHAWLEGVIAPHGL
ncbi:MAG TPA: inositol monophosphatase family protein [Longimicrobiaceae bacterium]|nr:inositol monophosphatase family protein [Longimicrobiaceae bacterium]